MLQVVVHGLLWHWSDPVTVCYRLLYMGCYGIGVTRLLYVTGCCTWVAMALE